MESNNSTYHRLQELLPDYVFGRISSEDKAFFEANYTEFLDLVDEVKQATNFFNRLEAMDFDKILSERTRNISVGVNKRLSKKQEKQSGLSFIQKVVFPSIGFAVLMIFAWSVFFTGGKTIEVSQKGIERLNEPILVKDLEAFNDEEMASISRIQNIISNEITTTVSNFFDTVTDSTSNEMLDDYQSTIELAYQQSPELFWGVGNNSNVSLINEIKNMSEIEFQELLEEIQNNENSKF